MARFRDEMTQRSIFDSCIYTFIGELKKECILCPLCTDSFEEVADSIRKHGQTRFLYYCDRCPIMIAFWISLKEVCNSDIRFCVNHYPVAMSAVNIKNDGANDDRLYTPRSFNFFYNKSVDLTLCLEMIKAEFARFKLPKFKRNWS